MKAAREDRGTMFVKVSNHQSALEQSADAQRQWASESLRSRGRAMREIQYRIADCADELCSTVCFPPRQSDAETLAAELIPLCEALRFLSRRGPAILAARKLKRTQRPLWLWGVRGQVQRVPYGRVLVIAPWNYPFLLAGVQAAQALMAGNSVLLKPAPGCEQATGELVQCFQDVVGGRLIQQLDSSVETAQAIIESGVEKIVLTGSSQTGRKVLAASVDRLTPVTLELSGCDAMAVLENATCQRVVQAVRFGLNFNGGATCIAPRRIFVPHSQLDLYRQQLTEMLAQQPAVTVHPSAREDLLFAMQQAIGRGMKPLGGNWNAEHFEASGTTRPLLVQTSNDIDALLFEDVFGPVATLGAYREPSELVPLIHAGNYALGVSIFGDHKQAIGLADQLNVGTVTINDLIVPTADPRVPFGGRGESGFGTTRGVEGLLSMTVPRVIMSQSLSRPLHLKPPAPKDAQVLAGALQGRFAKRWRQRARGWMQICGIRSH